MRAFFAVALLIVTALILWGFLTNPRLNPEMIATYLFDPGIMKGLLLSLQLTVIVMVGAIVIGTGLAVMSGSQSRIFRGFAIVYVWFFRGVPALVLLLFMYNLALFLPEIRIGLPFMPALATINTNDVMTPFLTAIIALTLHEAAYMAEIARAGIRSVGRDQHDAAMALGLSATATFRDVIFPQAARVAIPPTGNELIMTFKTTSLVSVIALSDLLYSAQQIYAGNYQSIPLLVVVTIWYLVVTSVLSVVQSLLERKLGARTPQRTLARVFSVTRGREACK